MKHSQSLILIVAVSIASAVGGYLLFDLLKHRAGGSVSHYNVVCPKGDITRAIVEYEQPMWWCSHCKTLHWTSETVLPD